MASTHTVQVRSSRFPAPIGAGSFRVDSTVAQSMPSAPMTCVPKVTVPERTAVPPELWKSRVTFSHQRRSVGSRTGSLTVSFAGVDVAGVEAVGAEVEGAEVEGSGGLLGGAVEADGVTAGPRVPRVPLEGWTGLSVSSRSAP